jgi:type IV conjugative transfer system coupling protein TraD
MKTPLNKIAKGLFNSKILLKDLRAQLIIFLSISIITLIAWFMNFYLSLDSESKTSLIMIFKAYALQLLNAENVSIETASTFLSNGYQTVNDVLNNPDSIQFVHKQFSDFLAHGTLPILIGFTAWLGLSMFFKQLGQTEQQNKIVEGTKLLTPTGYEQKLKNKQKSPIQIGNVHWYKGAEVQHLLIAGDPGTGKSQTLNQLLKSIRDNGDIAIVFDPKSDFVRDFYDSKIDQILTPFDKRSVNWSPWDDLEDDIALETFAEAVIKENKNDPFWSNSARMILIAGLKKANAEHWTFQKAIHFLTTSNFQTLSQWFDGTEVVSDFTNEKTASIIMTELKTRIKSLKYLTDVTDKKYVFSLQNWLNDNLAARHHGWLFLPLPEKYRAAYTPVISAQIELLANHILSLPTDRKRRIWFIVDELPSLPKLNALQRLLAQGRAYGVVGVLAIQNISQLKETYGSDGANSLAGLCSSALCLRTSDPATAEYFSKRLGKQLRKEFQENQSHSKNSHHKTSTDGQSEHIAERATVSETMLLRLDDLKGVFSSKGVYNPVLIDVKLQNLTPKNCAIEPLDQVTIKSELKAESEQKNNNKDWVI